MGVRITKDQSGVEALRKLSSNLMQELENTNKACDELKRSFDSVKDAVAHEKEIEEIIGDVADINSAAVKSIVEMAQRLNQTANRLEAFLNGGLGGNGSNP